MSFSTTFLPYTVPLSTAACIAFSLQSIFANCQLPTANCQLKDLRSRLSRIVTSSRDMISRLNVIVWALNPKYDKLESLVSYLRRYFGEYLENFNISFLADIPEEIPDLPVTPDTRRNILYVVQEAIHNAVKHSNCSEIRLAIQSHSAANTEEATTSPPNPLSFKERGRRGRGHLP